MKRNLMLFAAGLAMLVLAACNGSMPTLTFTQQVAIVCANADTAVQILTDDGVFTGGAQVTFTSDVQPALAKVCSAGSTVTTPNLKNLANTALPMLKDAVAASSLAAQAKNDANAAIDLVVGAINTAIVLQPAAVPTATPLSGAPIAPASAPVAASTVLVS